MGTFVLDGVVTITLTDDGDRTPSDPNPDNAPVWEIDYRGNPATSEPGTHPSRSSLPHLLFQVLNEFLSEGAQPVETEPKSGPILC